MGGGAFDLGNEVVVVTGGLGQLGQQFTRALAQAGARVAVLDRRAEPAQVESAFGPLVREGKVLFLEGDVTDRASLERALDELVARWGAPSGLINNAGLDSPPGAPASENGPFEEYSEESWDRVMDVNLKGVFLCCQVFGGAMARAGRGTVVNISSIYGVISPDQRIYEYRRKAGAPFFKPVAYSASKSGLMNLTRYLATYWAETGVRVNTLTIAGVFNGQDEHFLERYCARVPLGRMADPDEYNGVIVFLCSAASRYMTGSNLVVDGGWTAW